MKRLNDISNLIESFKNKMQEDLNSISNEIIKTNSHFRREENINFDTFLFEVSQSFMNISEVEILGDIVSGTVTIGEKLFFLDTNFHERYVVVKKIEQNNEIVSSATIGEARLFFKEEDAQYLEPGLTMEKINNYHKIKKVETYVNCQSKEIANQIQNKMLFSIEVCFDNHSFSGNILFSEGKDENQFIIISFSQEVIVQLGLTFALKENGKTIGEGKIISVME